MRAPAITLRCECGAEGRAGYGERWTCPDCERRYDTSAIPEEDYRAIQSLNRRYRLTGYGIVAGLALVVLAVALTGVFMAVFAGLAVVLLTWFVYLKPLVHRQHRRAVAALTRSWELKAE
jgi:hypothetical protein